MSEIKGLLWYLNAKILILIIIILIFLGINYKQTIILCIFAFMEQTFGFLYYIGFIDKMERRRRMKNRRIKNGR